MCLNQKVNIAVNVPWMLNKIGTGAQDVQKYYLERSAYGRRDLTEEEVQYIQNGLRDLEKYDSMIQLYLESRNDNIENYRRFWYYDFYVDSWIPFRDSMKECLSNYQVVA